MSNLDKVKKTTLYVFSVIGVLAVVVALFGVGSVSLTGGKTTSQSFGGISLPMVAPMADYEMARNSVSSYDESGEGYAEFDSASMNSAKTVSDIETADKKIIKNGSLGILVNKTEDTIQKITDLTNSMSGFVEDSQVYKSTQDTKSGYITVRVPAVSFEETIRQIKTFAEVVEREQITAQDVTADFVDMEARLKSLKAQETQFLSILKKAGTVKDILSVQKELGIVRSSIERLQGQIQVLSRQIEMSTITVNITSKSDVTILGIYWKPISVLKQSLHNLVVGMTEYIDYMIDFVFNLPVLILWLATYIFFGVMGWKVLRWVWMKYVKVSVAKK